MKINPKKWILFSMVLLVSLVVVACTNNTSYKNGINVVEPSVVGEQMHNDKVIVIDARSKTDYLKGHLKGAIHLSPSELTVSKPVKATIAPKEIVEKVLSSKGISNDSIIYIYDNNHGVNATRVWWTLKIYGHENVKVINNGQKGLELQGLEMSADVPSLPKTQYKAKDLNKNMIATLEEVKKYSQNPEKGVVILDVRSLPEYEEGAIPNSILYSHTKNLYNDGTFKSARDIYLNYNDLGIKREDTVIVYCRSSYRATQTALLLEEAGYKNVKVYDGAWLEWTAKSMSIQKVGEKVAPTEQDAS